MSTLATVFALLSFNTFGRNFRPVYDSIGSHNFCQHGCDVHEYQGISYKPGPADPCCESDLFDEAYGSSGSSEYERGWKY